MPIVTPVPIPAAPPAPQRNDPATFEERNDAAVEYQFNTLPDAINQQSEATYQNAVDAKESATTATQKAAQTKQDAEQTALDREQTQLDAQATAADRAQTGLDAAATAADRVQTGLDRQAVEDMLDSIADGPVASVNGKGGVVILGATDIAQAATDAEMRAGSEEGYRSMSPALVRASVEANAPAHVEKILIVIDEKPSGTAGGTNTTGAWQVRDLNTVVTNSIPGASLSGNAITLPAGTYDIAARVPASGTASHKARLYDITGSAVLSFGSSGASNQNSMSNTDSIIRSVISISTPKQIRIEHRTNVQKDASGFGVPNTFPGTPEVYTQLVIRKLA